MIIKFKCQEHHLIEFCKKNYASQAKFPQIAPLLYQFFSISQILSSWCNFYKFVGNLENISPFLNIASCIIKWAYMEILPRKLV